MLTNKGKSLRKSFYFVLLGIYFIAQCSQAQKYPPGVIVDHISADQEVYLGSPSIVIMKDGSYLASYQPFSKKLEENGKGKETIIVLSKDHGQTWNQIATVAPLTWANLFILDEKLYILGTAGHYGDLVIRRSDDGGFNWTHPVDDNNGLLRKDEEYHTAPVPILIHNGRIFRAMEDRNPPEGWGINFRAFVISAPINSDLLKASNWKTSNRLRYDKSWPGNAWLEGNVVISPKGDVWNILRNDFRPEGGRACIVKVSNNGEIVSFNPDNGFIEFPGGCKKFSIRYDEISKRYWALSNYIPEKFKGYNPERTRNTLALISSSDLMQWKVNKIIMQHPDVMHSGFQYADCNSKEMT